MIRIPEEAGQSGGRNPVGRLAVWRHTMVPRKIEGDRFTAAAVLAALVAFELSACR